MYVNHIFLVFRYSCTLPKELHIDYIRLKMNRLFKNNQFNILINYFSNIGIGIVLSLGVATSLVYHIMQLLYSIPIMTTKYRKRCALHSGRTSPRRIDQLTVITAGKV